MAAEGSTTAVTREPRQIYLHSWAEFGGYRTAWEPLNFKLAASETIGPRYRSLVTSPFRKMSPFSVTNRCYPSITSFKTEFFFYPTLVSTSHDFHERRREAPPTGAKKNSATLPQTEDNDLRKTMTMLSSVTQRPAAQIAIISLYGECGAAGLGWVGFRLVGRAGPLHGRYIGPLPPPVPGGRSRGAEIGILSVRLSSEESVRPAPTPASNQIE